MRRRLLIAGALGLVLVVWALVPLARGLLLLTHASAGTFGPALDGRKENVAFSTEDGVLLRGTYRLRDDARGTVILVHGFKNTRADMLDHSEFLYQAGYDVLMYDSRGCGESGGIFGVGATEDRDIRAAVTFVTSNRRGVPSRVAVLGVSLGAGDALLAAARDNRIDAVIADSAWADERVQLDRMRSLVIGPVKIPLLPYESVLVDAIIGGRLEDARPRDEVTLISPRPLLLIHSADDQNATTPLADAQVMLASAGPPKEMWIAPRGGHAGALGAAHDEYVRRVLGFLRAALG